MPSLLIPLYAAVESKLWELEDLRAWADWQIGRIDSPSTWLLDLSMSQNSEAAKVSIRIALMGAGEVLPSDYGDLLAGFIILRAERKRLAREDLLRELFDVCDAYGVNGLDVDRLGELASAEPDVINQEWPQFQTALPPLELIALAEERRLHSENPTADDSLCLQSA